MHTSDVADQRHDIADTAREAGDRARDAAGKAGGRLRQEVDRRSTEAGDRVAAHAEDIRSVGSALRDQGNTSAAGMADQAADRMERAGAWLRERDGDQLLGDLEDAGRRNPWAVVAGGAALGFALSRVLKASAAGRTERRRSGPPADTGPGPASGREDGMPRTGRFDRPEAPPEAPVSGAEAGRAETGGPGRP